MIPISFLFVDKNGANVHFEKNYIIVKHEQEVLTKIPIENLESIYIFSNVQVTSRTVTECLKRGICISYLSKGGTYYGRLQSIEHINVFRQRKQAALADTKFSLDLAKRIISGKIHNQEIILKRYARSENKNVDDLALKIRQSFQKIESCHTIPEIMGYEGNAAKLYFEGLGRLVHKEFAFKGRSKRPPKDEFNSMLSLGYSILMNEIYGKLENKGLNPYFGFIHSDRENHPTLASDIMEEWRATLIDSMVMSLINGHEIHKEHFKHDDDTPGYYLTKEGLGIYLRKYDNKMRTEVKYLDYIDYATSFRASIDLQINRLIKAIEEEDVSIYHPIWLR